MNMVLSTKFWYGFSLSPRVINILMDYFEMNFVFSQPKIVWLPYIYTSFPIWLYIIKYVSTLFLP